MKIEKIKVIETITYLRDDDIARKIFIEAHFSGASDKLMKEVIRYSGGGLFGTKDDPNSLVLVINKYIFGRLVVSYWSKSPLPFFMREDTIRCLSFELSSPSYCFKKDTFLDFKFFRNVLVRYEEDTLNGEGLYRILTKIITIMGEASGRSRLLNILASIRHEMEP